MQENLQGIPGDPSAGISNTEVPVSSGEAPLTDPSMMGGQSQMDPEEKAKQEFEINRMFDKVKEKDASFKERQQLDSKKLEGFKSKIVMEIFSLMREMGIDLSDLNSINEFLQKLQQQNPDLYIMFESAMNALSPKGMQGMPGQEMPGQEMPVSSGGGGNENEKDLMKNKTTNLQEGMLRQ